MENRINVLDHGFIELIETMGNDVSIVRNARHSYDSADQAGKDPEKDAKLIKYLLNHGHNTPFESVTLTFLIKAPLFVIRQWQRHRTQSYNEVSARYRQLSEEFYIPLGRTVGVQSKDNKQMRDIVNRDDSEELAHMLNAMEMHNKDAFRLYRHLLSQNMPRELARTVLPLGTYTHFYATANLHNFFKFLGERLHEHAQWEIQQYAQAMLTLIEPIVPAATKAFKDSLA